MRNQIIYSILFIFLILMLFSCSPKESYNVFPEEADYSEDFRGAPEPLALKESRSREELVAGNEKADFFEDKKSLSKSKSRDDSPSKDQSASDDSTDDKRIYMGYQKLRVADIEETKTKVLNKVEELGGYIESLYSYQIIMRIPKARFTECFNSFLKLGEVLNKSIHTFDVSDYFQDLSLRLGIARKARARLYVLLEKTEDVKERLKILREINRLSEEIESINLRLESLKQLIAYSKITLELVPRLAGNESRLKQQIPFDWISRLNGFKVSLPKLDGNFKMDLPDEFAVFTESKYYHAETPEGTVIRLGTTKNFPEGDNAFWQQALAYHLGTFYQNADKLDLGSYNAVLFSSKDKNPYFYLVAVKIRDKKIRILELLFPSKEAKDKHFNKLAGLIKEAK